MKDPSTAVVAPITVLSMAPLLMSTLLILTSPVPAGVRSILPFVFVLVIALPSTFRLSTRRSVTAELVPMVTPSIVPPLMSAVVTAPRLDTVAPERLTVPVAVSPAKLPDEGVPAPIEVPSTLPPSMFAVSASRASIFAVPSIYRSRHSDPVAPRS